MAKEKKKFTPSQKRAKRAVKEERQEKYQWVFMNGRQVRIKRRSMVDVMSVDEFMMRSADPIWLHQNEMWELIPVETPCFYVESHTRVLKQEISPVGRNDTGMHAFILQQAQLTVIRSIP